MNINLQQYVKLVVLIFSLFISNNKQPSYKLLLNYFSTSVKKLLVSSGNWVQQDLIGEKERERQQTERGSTETLTELRIELKPFVDQVET